MEVNGKDYLTWLHKVREEMYEEEKRSGLSGAEWMKKITKEVEEILDKKIPKIKEEFIRIKT